MYAGGKPPTRRPPDRPNQGKNNCDNCQIDCCLANVWCNGDPQKLLLECLASRPGNPIANPPHGIVYGDGDKSVIRLCRSYFPLHKPPGLPIKTVPFNTMRQAVDARDSGVQTSSLGTIQQATPIVQNGSAQGILQLMGDQV